MSTKPPSFYCGIDWSTTVHDVAVVDRHGTVVARARITTTPDGVRELFGLLEGLRNSHTHGRKQVPIAIETPHHLLVHALRAKGQPIVPVPPNMVVRERRRRSPAAKKCDRTDAELLADILREGWARLRPLPDNSPEAAAIAVLADAQWQAQRNRTQQQARLWTVLSQAHPPR